MTPQPIIVTMLVPLGSGMFVTIEFDPSEPVDFAPVHFSTGARLSQQGAPLRLKPLKESGTGAPLLQSATGVAQDWRSPSPARGVSWQKTKKESDDPDELQDARTVLAEKAAELASMDSTLAPVRQREQNIRDAILATHSRQGSLVVLNLGNRGERLPLFAKLDEIALEWGWLKSQRKNLHNEIRALERHIDHIKRSIDRAAKKRRA